MCARAPGGSRVDDPRRGVDIQGQQMTMTVNDGARARKASAQQPMTITRRSLVAVDDDQMSAGQRLVQPLGQMDEQRAIFRRPFARDIVIAGHCQHATQPGLDLGKDGGVTDVAAMHSQIAALDDVADARIQCAMGVGQNGDPHQRHGRDSVQKWFVRRH